MTENLLFKKINISFIREAIKTFTPNEGHTIDFLLNENLQNDDEHSKLSITASEETIANFKNHLSGFLQ